MTCTVIAQGLGAVECKLEKTRTVIQLKDGTLAGSSYDSRNALWIWSVPEPQQPDAEPEEPPVVTRKLLGSKDLIHMLIELRDGRLMSWGEELIVRIWNMNTDKCGWTLQGHEAAITQASQLRDGTIMTCSRDKKLLKWQMPAK